MATKRIVASSCTDRKCDFPLLNARTIYEYLCDEFSKAESDFVPELGDVESPKDKSMGRLYSELFYITMGYRMELEPPFQAMENIQFPEMYRECIPKLMFLRAMKKMTAAVGISDFGMQDIVTPRKQRTLYILSGIVNFLKFYRTYDDEREVADIRMDELDSTRQANETQLFVLREREAQIKQKMAEGDAQAEQVRAVNFEKEEQLRLLDSQQQSRVQRKEELKQRVQVTKDTDAAVMVHFTAVKEQLNHLESQVVESPDRVTAEIERMKDSIHRSMREVRQIHDQSSVKRASISFMDGMAQLLERLTLKLNEVEQRQQDIRRYLKLLEDQDEEKIKLKTQMKRLIAEEEHGKRKMDMLKANAAQQLKQSKMITEAYEQDQQRFGSEGTELLQLQEKIEKSLKELDVKEDQIRKEMENCRVHHKELTDQLEQAMRDTIREVNEEGAAVHSRMEPASMKQFQQE